MARDLRPLRRRASGPKQPVEHVARAIVDVCAPSTPRGLSAPVSRALAVLNAVAPGFTDRLVRKYGGRRDRQRRTSACHEHRDGAAIARAVREHGRTRAHRRRLGPRPADGHRARRTSTSRSTGCGRRARASPARRFGPVNAVGESFTVYKVGDIDVALPRRESKVGRGHKGFEVVGDPRLSAEEAARRRDFTVNAIAWDPLTDDYVDPFDGRGDCSSAGC